jgi:CobQ-like glutamine amidotransferase family enzyme
MRGGGGGEMTIEILYPEVCNLYGDLMNIEYLRRAVPEAEVVKTSLKTRPAFLDRDVSLVYLSSMTERAQILVRDAMTPHLDALKQKIEEGLPILATGNAMELFIREIQDEDGTKTPMLGLFDLQAKRTMERRYNALYLGRFEDMDILGFKSQFSHAYGGEDVPALFETVRGAGRNPGETREGIRYKNFMATYLLGPLLVLNPPFTRLMLRLIGAGDRPVPFEKAAMDAYTLRLDEFKDPKRGFTY